MLGMLFHLNKWIYHDIPLINPQIMVVMSTKLVIERGPHIVTIDRLQQFWVPWIGLKGLLQESTRLVVDVSLNKTNDGMDLPYVRINLQQTTVNVVLFFSRTPFAVNCPLNQFRDGNYQNIVPSQFCFNNQTLAMKPSKIWIQPLKLRLKAYTYIQLWYYLHICTSIEPTYTC